MTARRPPVDIALPAAALRPYVSHYWRSLNNADHHHRITPDGAVDAVIVVGTNTCRIDAYGTTTAPADVPLALGCHYLGIRFRPGQSRHFMDAAAAELTNAVHTADDVAMPDLSRATEQLAQDHVFTELDAALQQHLTRHPPKHTRIDEVIRHIEARRGAPRVSELANLYCKSRRQLERNFLSTVGLPAKLFAEITRFRHAASLLTQPSVPLAQIAAALGYTDQSHFTHEFVRFFGQTPAQARQHAAFLQDAKQLDPQNANGVHLD